MIRTGAPWWDLPERYGPWRTIASRFYRWRKDDLWDRVLMAVQEQANIQGKVNWEVHYADGTMVRAHQHAAGARGKPQKSQLFKLGQRCLTSIGASAAMSEAVKPDLKTAMQPQNVAATWKPPPEP